MQTCTLGKVRIGGDAPPAIMGVINCSPESFYTGSFVRPEELLQRASEMVTSGAKVIDLGARSTAPGSPPLTVDEEIGRIKTALETLEGSGYTLSVDTIHPEVLRACLRYEIHAVNDIGGLSSTEYAIEAGDSGLPVIAMASFRRPGDAKGVEETKEALALVLKRAEKSGIDELILDPGVGRWTEEKTRDDDWALCSFFHRFCMFDRPLLAAVSRKTFIGDLTGREDPKTRLAGTLAVTYDLLGQGASIIRTHDVKETSDLICVYDKLRKMA